MGDVRKAIIELISDYMDKTLGMGCIYKYTVKSKYTGFDIIGKYKEYSMVEYHIREGNIIILGHYDITAVLKYMFDMVVEMTIDIEFIAFYYSGYLGKIPNKPLHLYSEQEEKDLLDILTKLK